MQVGMQFWRTAKESPSCWEWFAWRGEAERWSWGQILGLGNGSSGASASPCVSLCPKPSCFPGSGMKSKVFALSNRNIYGARWTEMDGAVDGVTTGLEAALWLWHCLCVWVQSCLLAMPVPSPSTVPAKRMSCRGCICYPGRPGYKDHGELCLSEDTFCLDPWQQEPAGLVTAAGESGAGASRVKQGRAWQAGDNGSFAGLERGEQSSLCYRVEITGFICREEDGLPVRSGGWGAEHQDRLKQTADVRSRGRDGCIQKRKGNMN